MSSGLARDILDLTLEHLFLVSLSMAIAAALAIPAGILLTRRTSFNGGCWGLRISCKPCRVWRSSDF